MEHYRTGIHAYPYGHHPEPLVESKINTILWDFADIIGRTIQIDRPDIVITTEEEYVD